MPFLSLPLNERRIRNSDVKLLRINGTEEGATWLSSQYEGMLCDSFLKDLGLISDFLLFSEYAVHFPISLTFALFSLFGKEPLLFPTDQTYFPFKADRSCLLWAGFCVSGECLYFK